MKKIKDDTVALKCVKSSELQMEAKALHKRMNGEKCSNYVKDANRYLDILGELKIRGFEHEVVLVFRKTVNADGTPCKPRRGAVKCLR